MKNNVAYNHPDFIRAAERWYKGVRRNPELPGAEGKHCDVFKLCNEIPTEDLDDRNPENLGSAGRTDFIPAI